LGGGDGAAGAPSGKGQRQGGASLLASPAHAPPLRLSYQLGFIPERGFSCGASLIRPDVALTAAHCLPAVLDDAALDQMSIFAGGAVHWEDDRTDLAEFAVRGVIPHPKYQASNSRNDIALVFLDSCIDLGPNATVVPLATQEGGTPGRAARGAPGGPGLPPGPVAGQARRGASCARRPAVPPPTSPPAPPPRPAPSCPGQSSTPPAARR
jgi:hypothetical protein